MKAESITYYPTDENMKFLKDQKAKGISFVFTINEAIKEYKKKKKK